MKKRLLVTLKKKVDPQHKLITTPWITDEEVTAIRKKYGNQFDPDDPISLHERPISVGVFFGVGQRLTPVG